jgi:hypothetical protein
MEMRINKAIALFTLLLYLAQIEAFGQQKQDLITLKNGIAIPCVISLTSDKEVFYKLDSLPANTVRTLSTDQIRAIDYSDGRRMTFGADSTGSRITPVATPANGSANAGHNALKAPPITPEDYFRNGVSDAKERYHRYGGATGAPYS